jgi:DNA polymerase III sliding clamp (beta) subunit (PCNA family)
MIEALSRHAEAVIVRLNAAQQPIVIVDADDVNRLTSVVMPMRI